MRSLARRRTVGALLVAAAASMARAEPAIEVREDLPLPVSYRHAFDVRWLDENRIALAVFDGGVIALDRGMLVGGTMMAPANRHDDSGFWVVNHLAVSQGFMAVAASFFELKWRRRESGPMVAAPRFEGVEDIDLQEEKLLAIGIRRVGPKAELAPDGAIAWLGSLANDLRDLRPIHFSESGPGAKRMIACGSFGLGLVRFLPGGDFVVVPGAEPGIFLRSSSGDLQKVWDTQALGLGAPCDFDAKTEELYAADILARWQYLNRFDVIEEILPWGDGFALVVKQIDGSGSRWHLLTFDREGGAPARTDLPLESASRQAHLKGDRRGDHLVLVVAEEIGENGQSVVPRLVFAEVVNAGSASATAATGPATP